MKIPNKYYFLSLIPSIRGSLIQNKKLCINCKYFIANKQECGKFGDIDLVTGKETYYLAQSVRRHEIQCGEEAKYFEKNNIKFITLPYYFMLKYSPIILAIGLYSMIFIAIRIKFKN
jgi:hypothetical protein